MRFAKWLFDWLMLIPLFLGELAKSVYDVLQNVINPERVGASAIVKVPLDVKSDLGIALVANMVTLTPAPPPCMWPTTKLLLCACHELFGIRRRRHQTRI